MERRGSSSSGWLGEGVAELHLITDSWAASYSPAGNGITEQGSLAAIEDIT